jgi:hypothetical protein
MLELEIPLLILQGLFPSKNLSINKFIVFKLPYSVPAPYLLADLHFHTSDQQPDASPDALQNLLFSPAPPSSVIEDLIDSVMSAAPSKAKSVMCTNIQSGEQHHFPLWLITYWHEINFIIETQQRWLKASDCLRKLLEKNVQLVHDANEALPNVAWSGKIGGFQEREEMVYLSDYATGDWLRTVHENQMLELLLDDITYDFSTNPKEITIQLMYFANTILSAFRDRHKKPQRRRLRALGQALVSGVTKFVGTIVNYKKTHWAAIVLDFGTQTIWHGDSLDFGMDPGLLTALKWWIQQHHSASFRYKKMLITNQLDGHSCGLLAWNSLAHFFLPERHPLIDPLTVAAERLRVLLRVCEKHDINVSPFLM